MTCVKHLPQPPSGEDFPAEGVDNADCKHDKIIPITVTEVLAPKIEAYRRPGSVHMATFSFYEKWLKHLTGPIPLRSLPKR
jgi:hypothetical protein